MRRAIVAAAGTVVGLVALLDYKSAGTIRRSTVAVGGAPGGGAPSAAGSSAPPTGGAGGSGTGSASPTPGASPSSAPGSPAGPGPRATAGSAPATYTGIDVPYNYGDIQLSITVAGGRITHIAVAHESATDPRSAFINSQAVPILVQEAMSAQSLNFDVVSGATFTSEAFGQAFQSALGKAGR